MFDVDYMLWWLVLMVFHLTEGLFAYTQHRVPLSWRSMLFSRAYLLALVAATVEHVLLRHMFSEWLIRKRVSLAAVCSISVPRTRYAGLMLCLVGEGIRKGSMWTLGPAFTHEIAREHRMTHRLHQQGFYALCRHPAYSGWMIWLIGTQVLLRNAICCIVFPMIAWSFFRQRIAFEEEHLERFFGTEYRAYRSRTFSGIPGIP